MLGSRSSACSQCPSCLAFIGHALAVMLVVLVASSLGRGGVQNTKYSTDIEFIASPPPCYAHL